MAQIQINEEIWNHLYEDPLLQADVWSWWKWRNSAEVTLEEAFQHAILYKEFRSLVSYRVRDAGKTLEMFRGWTFAMELNIYTPKIGGGFRVQHGHSTWVMAESIGEDFHVNQNVTIGMAKGGKPRIGKGVRIFTGAVVVGDITIGDYVTIAPNAFVNFDVPAGKKVFPARSIIV